jgi:hypothetical protein
MSDKITFTLDGRTVSAAPGETIWQVPALQGSPSAVQRPDS